jgi:ABC-type glycerol-3-phosphate transport system permease component
MRLLNSYWALILPNIAGGQVLAIFLLRGFFASLPEELFESARMDGAGMFQVYRNIALPLSRPILSVIAITTFLSCWNEFLWPLVTINIDAVKPITTGLLQFNSQYGSQTGILFASYVLSSLPLVVLFLFASSTFVKGITSGALKM